MKHLYSLLLGGGLLLAGCNADTKTGSAGTAGVVSGTLPADTAFTITISARPPQDLPPGADAKQLAEFAWAEFFALNWKSSYDTIRYQRDTPDTTWTYRQSDPALAVWETYAHRTELRPYRGGMRPFNSKPAYSFRALIPPARPGVSFSLFDNLDENNEIGSCNVYGQVKAGQPMVLYQAKVNRAEYDYIRQNYPTPDSLFAATMRTKANIKAYHAYYNPNDPNRGKYKGTCIGPRGVICLPCGGDPAQGGRGAGTIEIKTAWRQLTPADDVSRFLTRKVVYYHKQLVKGIPVTVYDNATFALIGLHIIHKTVNYPDFVFATWEHVDVEQANMGLRLILTNKQGKDSLGALQAPYPRLHPITAVANRATAAAHRQLRALNPKSVLLNYRLVGVQGTPTSTTTTPNFFLANYVVESDSTLANFHGSGIGTPHNQGLNTLYKGKFLSAGGCQGCHGVAQLTGGTDLTFLLDTVDKPVRAPDIDESQRNKLVRYIRATIRR